MKKEFELDIDDRGHPCIRLKYYDKSRSLEREILRTFLIIGVKNGCDVNCKSLNFTNNPEDSFIEYEIRLNSK